MAKEVSTYVQLRATSGNTSIASSTADFRASMAGDQVYLANPAITTTPGAVPLGPVDTSQRFRLFLLWVKAITAACIVEVAAAEI
ncbi:MAG: hypothetical protein KIT22_15210 [Verrucomicrobiae bacterium]|nr:hypothetical protein [Verrucomicrobiae bacterium]